MFFIIRFVLFLAHPRKRTERKMPGAHGSENPLFVLEEPSHAYGGVYLYELKVYFLSPYRNRVQWKIHIRHSGARRAIESFYQDDGSTII